MTKDNYWAVAEYDKQRFLQGNAAVMAKNTRLHIEDNHIIVPLFLEYLTVDMKTGAINYQDKKREEPSVFQKMLIYHHLLEAREGAEITGDFITIRGVKDAWVHERAFENAGTKPLAQAFEGNLAAFKAVGKNMGLETAQGGDQSFILPALPMIPLKIIFWDGEEDIPAAANILFDPSITDFTHPEDVIGLGEAAAELFIKKGLEFLPPERKYLYKAMYI